MKAKCWAIWLDGCWPGPSEVTYYSGGTRGQAHSYTMSCWADATGRNKSEGFRHLRSRRAPEFDGLWFPHPMSRESAEKLKAAAINRGVKA